MPPSGGRRELVDHLGERLDVVPKAAEHCSGTRPLFAADGPSSGRWVRHECDGAARHREMQRALPATTPPSRPKSSSPPPPSPSPSPSPPPLSPPSPSPSLSPSPGHLVAEVKEQIAGSWQPPPRRSAHLCTWQRAGRAKPARGAAGEEITRRAQGKRRLALGGGGGGGARPAPASAAAAGAARRLRRRAGERPRESRLKSR